MPKSNFNGTWNKFRLFTPPVIRLLAVKRTQGSAIALTDEEISEASGLSVKRIKEIYWSKTWNDIPLGEVKRFFDGCGFNLDDSYDVKLITKKLKANTNFKWKHIRVSENHKLYERLLPFALEA